MSEAKFTKGEWIIGKTEDDYKALSIDIECSGGLTELASISGVIDCRYECEESKANANLMSAAPNMLEALLSIENDNGAIPEAIWDLRNKAIAKALGAL